MKEAWTEAQILYIPSAVGDGPLKSLKTAKVRPLFYHQILAIISLMPGVPCDIPGLSLTWLALASVSVEYTRLRLRTAQRSTQCAEILK